MSASLPLRPAPPAPPPLWSDLSEMLWLALGGPLPAGRDLSRLLDRMEAAR